MFEVHIPHTLYAQIAQYAQYARYAQYAQSARHRSDKQQDSRRLAAERIATILYPPAEARGWALDRIRGGGPDLFSGIRKL